MTRPGGPAAIAMWVDFMRAALAGRPEATLKPPSGLARVPIDPTTGALAVAEDGFLHTAPPPMIDQVF